jgi:hypothetical protein
MMFEGLNLEASAGDALSKERRRGKKNRFAV